MFLIACSFILNIMTGPASLLISDVISTLLFMNTDPSMHAIVWIFRMPISIMAIVVGVSLGLSGAGMQTVLGNPLASPYTLGISSAAGFGAALAIVLGVSILPVGESLLIPANAFIFSLVSCFVIYGVSKIKNATSEIMILSGIAILFLFDALLALLEYMANPEQVSAIVFWLFGSLNRTTWSNLFIVFVVLVIIFPLFIMDAWKLTALRLGENKARSLGVNVDKLRIKGLILVSILTATAVSFVGSIGFVGLVAPHISRMIVGEDHRYFLIASGLTGGCILSVASVLSNIIKPGIIFPIGILTSLIGIPFFAWLILSSKKGYW